MAPPKGGKQSQGCNLSQRKGKAQLQGSATCSTDVSTMPLDFQRWAFNADYIDGAAETSLRLAPHLCAPTEPSDDLANSSFSSSQQECRTACQQQSTSASAPNPASLSRCHSAPVPRARTNRSSKERSRLHAISSLPSQALASAAVANAPRPSKSCEAQTSQPSSTDTEHSSPSEKCANTAERAMSTLSISRDSLQCHTFPSTSTSSSASNTGASASLGANSPRQDRQNVSGRGRRASSHAYVPSSWDQSSGQGPEPMNCAKRRVGGNKVLGTSLSSGFRSSRRKMRPASANAAATKATEQPNGLGRLGTVSEAEGVRAE